MKVIWKDIPGFEGMYQASNKGDIKSCSRITKRGTQLLTIRERILKGAPDGAGYLVVNLRKNNKTHCFRVHQLIIWAFKGLAPGDYEEVRHKSGVVYDNRITNLRASSIKRNQADRLVHGTLLSSGLGRRAKIDPEKVGHIRNSGKPILDLALELNLSPRHIYSILSGKFWPPTKYEIMIDAQLKLWQKEESKNLSKIMLKTIKEMRLIAVRGCPVYLRTIRKLRSQNVIR